MTAGVSRAAMTITPQPALAPSPQPRPAPTERALIAQNAEKGGPFWMPIRGPDRTLIDSEKFELLIAFLTFIRSSHYWTLMHPELALEDDVKELLRGHEKLARMLLEDTEAGHCEMGSRLFEELESLRDLNERQELEKAKRALEESGP